jgi:hypothetical protein
MADQDTIREFLVGLSFDLDTNSQRRFVEGVSGATKLVAGLAGSLAGLVAATTAAAAGMERLYFAANRTQASVAGIRSLQYAVANLGGSADEALSSIEGIARFIRTNPGGEGFLGALGVGTRDGNGQLRDTAAILQDLGKQFAQMPYYQAAKRASLLGIDEKTLQALISGVGQFSDEYKKMASDVGFNADNAAKASHDFMVQVRGLWGELGILSDKFFSTFAETLTPVIEQARKKIEANAGLIGDWINRIVNVLGVLAKIVATVVTRSIEIFDKLYAQFEKLSPETKQLTEIVLGLYGAFTLLNIAFAASPIGRILALGTALVLLYDDYQTWKEGGQSLIDWDKWEPGINAAIEGLKTLAGWLTTAFDKAKALSDQVFGGTDAGDTIGKYTTSLLAAFGNKDAQDALARQARADLHIAPNSTTAAAGGSRAPRGIRTNNPGNLRTGANGAFGAYATPADGLAALGRQLNLYATGQSRAAGGRRLDTIQDIISTYAPSNENDTGAYVAALSKQLGVSPTAHLNLQDADTLASLMRGIVGHENGQNPYSNDQYRTAANAALGRGNASINQQTTINVNGTGNPSEVANRTATAQNVVNQRLARNLETAAQ